MLRVVYREGKVLESKPLIFACYLLLLVNYFALVAFSTLRPRGLVWGEAHRRLRFPESFEDLRHDTKSRSVPVNVHASIYTPQHGYKGRKNPFNFTKCCYFYTLLAARTTLICFIPGHQANFPFSGIFLSWYK